MPPKPRLCLDTNIILIDATNVLVLSRKYDVCIPETVIDELDNKKSGVSEIAYQARAFGRLLTSFTSKQVYEEQGCLVTKLTNEDNISIRIISLNRYPVTAATEPNIANDRKIIAAVLAYSQLVKIPVYFMTNDVMCKIRATSVGLKILDLHSIESTDVEYTKCVTITSSDVFNSLNNKTITDIDENYCKANYNYVFTDSVTGQTKLGVILQGKIVELTRELEAKLRDQDAPPRNREQLFLAMAIQEPSITLVTCNALAGSGKTVCALSNAIALMRKRSAKKYSGILYIRASVSDLDKAEEVGFLPGLEEKFAPYLHPLEDALDFIVRGSFKDKEKATEIAVQQRIQQFKEQCNITSTIGLGIRGRTFNNVVAIIDEAQNYSEASLQRVLSRFDRDCKVILIGSNKQIDNPFITKYNNGLSKVLQASTTESTLINTHVVTLSKVLRSPLTEWAEQIFEKKI